MVTGTARIVEELRRLEVAHGDAFRAAPLLVQLAEAGRSFGDRP